MATLKELVIKLEELKKRLDADRERNLLIVLNDTKALVASRVQNEGKKADGSNFEPYSDNGVPAYLLFNKTKPNGSPIESDVDILDSDYGPYVSHSDVREHYGLPTNMINLTYTGEMWRNVGVQVTEVTESTVTAELKGLTEASQDKITWNSLRYGDILQPSEEEISIMRAAALEIVVKTINNIFNV